MQYRTCRFGQRNCPVRQVPQSASMRTQSPLEVVSSDYFAYQWSTTGILLNKGLQFGSIRNK